MEQNSVAHKLQDHFIFPPKGSSVTLTKFDCQDNRNNMTAFGFTIKKQDTGKEFKYYFVPGPNEIEIVEKTEPQYAFQLL